MFWHARWLPLLLVSVLAPLPAAAQSIFTNSGPATPGQLTTSPPAQTDRPPKAAPTPGETKQSPAAPARQRTPEAVHNPKKRQPQPIPPGSVIAPPGSIVLPPSSVRPPQNRRRDTRRLSAAARCNQRQISCNQTCNSRTMGGARTLCYRQCYAKMLHCINRLNALP